MPIRVVVAEDSLLVREGIAKLLESQSDIEVVALVDDLPSLLAAVAGDPPDVVVTDIRMPPTGTDEGVQAATRLRETNPELGRRRAVPVRRAGLRPRPPRRRAPSAARTC